MASGASGAFGDLVVSFPTRIERAPGTTSPEELLAAAHASCFCMSLAYVLGQHGNLPEQIETTVIIDLDREPRLALSLEPARGHRRCRASTRPGSRR